MRPHLLKHGAIPWVDEMLSNLPQQEPNEDFINYLTRLNKCGRELFQKLERELVAVTEQRDKALQKIKNQAERIAYLEGATNHATGTPLSKAIEQRDRLATALENCREDSVELLGERDWWQLENRGDYQQRYQTTRDNVTHADAALQSLNQNKQ